MKNAGASFRKFSLVFLALTSVLRCAPAGLAQSSPRTWAVIIGISKYPGLPGGQQLQFAERDAQSFAAALQSAGISPANIKLLLGTQANLTGVKEALGSWLANSAGPQDTAIIYFSGHGYVEQHFDEAYLLAQDSNLQNVFATGLSVAEIKHIVEGRLRAGRVLILQDSIRKDMFDPDSDGPGLTETFFKAVSEVAASKANTSVIIASSPGEFSREGRRWGEMGVFTKTLIDGMTGKADRNGDGSVTDVELFRFLSDQLPAETSGKQHPWRTNEPATEAVLSRGQAGGPRIASAGPPGDVSSAVNGRNAPVQANQSPPIRQTAERAASSAPSQPSASRPGTTPQSGASVPARSQTGAMSEPSQTAAQHNIPVSRPAELPTGSRPVGVQPTPPDSSAAKSVAGTGSGPPGASSPTTVGVSAASPRAAAAAKSPSTSAPAPAGTTPSAKTQPSPPPSKPVAGEPPVNTAGGGVTSIAVREPTAPPKPSVLLPNPGSIAATAEVSSGAGPVGSLPATSGGTTPSPLVLQLELAIDQGSLVSPAGSSAWDLYQKLAAIEPPAREMPQLKSRLAEALLTKSKAIVVGDVRADNISSNVDDFRLAGQMLTRLHGLEPDNPDISRLQKLSAAEALIALQFYDEAAKALEPLRTPPVGWVENALGLASAGQLSDYEAERHFKRAIELEPKLAAPHYNLAILYRNQKKDASLAEFEQAARLDASNAAILSALGDDYFERKQWNEAASSYRAALTARPDDGTLHTKLGHALYSQGLRAEADKEYQKAKELAGRK